MTTEHNRASHRDATLRQAQGGGVGPARGNAGASGDDPDGATLSLSKGGTPWPGFRAPKLWFDDVSVGDELPPLTKTVTTQQLAMYAGASGDFVPIHFDKDIAAAAGHPKVIVHGALKSAFMAQMITDWVGDTGRLVALSVSYRGVDYPDDPLTCRGRVTKTRVENGVGFVDLEVSLENGVGQVTTPGTATVALPMKESVIG